MSILNKSNLIPDGYVISSYFACRLGLREDYFKIAHKRDYELNIEMIIEYDKFLFVKPPIEVITRLNQFYAHCRITKDEVEDYEYVYKLSKNCLIGFWK